MQEGTQGERGARLCPANTGSGVCNYLSAAAIACAIGGGGEDEMIFVHTQSDLSIKHWRWIAPSMHGARSSVCTAM